MVDFLSYFDKLTCEFDVFLQIQFVNRRHFSGLHAVRDKFWVHLSTSPLSEH